MGDFSNVFNAWLRIRGEGCSKFWKNGKYWILGLF